LTWLVKAVEKFTGAARGVEKLAVEKFTGVVAVVVEKVAAVVGGA
jgi:hypothetical protein